MGEVVVSEAAGKAELCRGDASAGSHSDLNSLSVPLQRGGAELGVIGRRQIAEAATPRGLTFGVSDLSRDLKE